jgi:hypothetical protein
MSHIKVLLFIIVFSGISIGQQFHRSGGLDFFNRGEYKVAIDSLLQWADKYTAEQGIANYYIGESYYNLGMDAINTSLAIDYLKEAVRYFDQAIQQTDLLTIYKNKIDYAKYKHAWCYYRLAELEKNPLDFLEKAFRLFDNISSTGKDTFSVYSAYMAGESRFRIAEWKRTQLMLTTNEGDAIELAQDVVNALKYAQNIFHLVADSRTVSNNIRSHARFHIQDVLMEWGKLYQRLPLSIFSQIRDDNKLTTSYETSINLLRKVQYKEILNTIDIVFKDKFRPIVVYSEIIKALNIYLITGEDQDKQALNNLLDDLRFNNFRYEKLFFMANRDYRGGIDNISFSNLTNQNTSLYIKAAEINPEAWYWLGWAQFITNDNASRNSFERFLEETSSSMDSPRSVILREDAQFRLFLLEFDQNAANKIFLKELIKKVKNFHPQNYSIKERTELLFQLIQVGLGEKIWGQVLTARTNQDKLRDAFILIRSMLVRATRVIGKERVPYLNYLDKLFEITTDRMIQATTFYRGLSLFLKAEIQETTQKKRKYYIEAADMLKMSKEDYKYEGLYIQARSYFASAKHESNERRINNVYNKAKPMFVKLINEAKSLRSVYYLGEIFRIQGNHLAARKCYETVIEKTKNQVNGSFWWNNALAGIQSCTPKGDMTVLDNILIGNVKFPEKLLVVNNEEISLEKFADPDYIRKQYWETSVDLLIKFGLPQKYFYPSISRLNNSRFYKNTFHNITSGIKERVRTVSSGLYLEVNFPDGIKHEAIVTLDGIPLEKNERGFYEKIPISLNRIMEISILGNHCYPFVKQHQFRKLGIEKFVISLNRRIEFVYVPSDKEIGISYLSFPQRLDRNTILQSNVTSLSKATFLYRKFQSDIRYRDFSYSKILDGYLVVQDGKANPILYRNDTMVSKEGEFQLAYNPEINKIQKPEGIAVDSKGNIFIVDWQNHRICVFSNDGRLLRCFGSFGENSISELGKPVFFIFPKRIAISEDYAGIEMNGKRIFKTPILFVTDRNGIHLMNDQGIYWDTIIPPDFENGSLYGITTRGYGENTKLYVMNRKKNKIESFIARLIDIE